MRSTAAVLSTVVAAVLALVAATLTLAAPASAAGTAYLWRGLGDIQSWTDPLNWLPNGVPGNGDSATIEAYNDNICHAHVTGVPTGLQLTDLTVDEHLFGGDPASPCLTSLDDGSITVTHQLTFHAGTIDTPITLAAGATGTVTPGAAHDTTHFGGPVTVDGGLTIADTSDPENLSLTGSPGITVDAGGTLTTQGDDHVSADCCNSPAHVTNNGTLQIGAGTLNLDAVELDQNALLDASGGGTVLTDFAPQTAGPGARWTGSGAWQLGYSSRTTVSGTQTLAKTFSWQLGGNGSGAEEYLQGTFNLAGTGRFVWNGGEIGAAMTIGSGIRFTATGANTPDDPRELSGAGSDGNPAAVTNRGSMTFGSGAGWHGTSGAQIVNASTGVLTLGKGVRIGADCCNTPASIVNSGGQVVVPANVGKVVVDNTGYRATGGSLQVGGGSDLELTGGAAGSLSTTTITGGGTVGVAQPVTTAGTETVDTGTTLALEAAGSVTTTGTATTTVGGAGSFLWTGGSVTGALTVSTATGQTVSGTANAKNILVPTGSSGSTVTFSGPTTVVAGTAKSPDTLQGDPAATLVFTGVVTLQNNTLLAVGAVTTTGTATTRVEVSAASKARIQIPGRADLGGTLVLVDLSGYQPATGATLAVAVADPVAVSYGCVTTTGDGAATQHWTTRVAAGTKLQIVSKAGAATAC